MQEGILEYNPYTARCSALKKSLTSAENEMTKWAEQLKWYSHFDQSLAFTELSNATRDLDALDKKLNGIKIELAAHESHVRALKAETKLGWDPRHWFSKQRDEGKRRLRAWEVALRSLIQKHDALNDQIKIKTEHANKQNTQLERHRRFNPLEAEAAVNALDAQVARLTLEIEQLQPLMHQVDLQLAAPMIELAKISHRAAELELEIIRAKEFEKELSSCENGYERKLVHDQCSDAFGESSPKAVISSKQRERQSINRNIEKLHSRLQAIARRATRTIKTIVIDGNNLCYQHQAFIGLAALQVLIPKLSNKYVVVIVFDATVRRLLQSHDREIAACFGDSARVHIVASKQKADETLLDAAADEFTYVISNDRFRDFPEKSAVKKDRLIKHEILNGKIIVRDLDVAADFEQGGTLDVPGSCDSRGG